MSTDDRTIGQPLPLLPQASPPQPTASISVLGGPVEYEPLSDDAIAQVLARCTPKQRLILQAAARGLDLGESAEHVGVSRDTVVAWRKQIPGYRNAYYSCLAMGRTVTVQGLRQVAESDALQHYEVLHELAAKEGKSARENTVRLQAAKEALTIAGAYKDEALPPGESLEITAIRIRRSREAGKEGPETPVVDAAFTPKDEGIS